MRMKLVQAAACAVLLAFAAQPAPAQQLVKRAPNIDSSKMDESIRQYQDAVKYYQNGQFNLAEKELEKFLGKVGEHAGGNFLMGMVRVQQGDFEKARTSFRTTVKLDPAMVSPHGWLGALEAVLGDPAAAQAQRAELEKMKAACAETCPKAAEIATELQRIDENVAMAAGGQKPPG
jgi:Flp pilus assembly protein TadD